VNGSQGHEGHQQHGHSDDQEASVSIAAGHDEAGDSGGQNDPELKRDAGIRGWEEHIDHLMMNARVAHSMPELGLLSRNTL
jgi:hypothetical protein